MSSEHLFHKWGAGVAPDLPRVERAYDEFLVTDEGEELVDAAAGAAVANLGHSVPGVADVVAEQTDRVSYLSTSHFSHATTEALADRLADLAPADLDTVFLVGSGSEANEAAFKLAHSYHRARGNPGSTRSSPGGRPTTARRWARSPRRGTPPVEPRSTRCSPRSRPARPPANWRRPSGRRAPRRWRRSSPSPWAAPRSPRPGPTPPTTRRSGGSATSTTSCSSPTR